jgi:hypothetical protein
LTYQAAALKLRPFPVKRACKTAERRQALDGDVKLSSAPFLKAPPNQRGFFMCARQAEDALAKREDSLVGRPLSTATRYDE